MTGYRPTVAVHLIRPPHLADADQLDEAFFSHFFEDVRDLGAHGLRIPLRVWPAVPSPARVLSAIRNVIVLPLDDAACADEEWIARSEALFANLGDDDRLLPVALSAAALELDSPLTDLNFIRLQDVAAELRIPVLLNRVTHILCRLLGSSPDPVKVFLSHAKTDGVAITKQVRDFLQEGAGVRNFFDAQDIGPGELWKDVIRGAARERNVLLAVRTDDYATREWCRTEVIEAKAGGSAMVVLDALETMEVRGFPYLGNTPSVRWQAEQSQLAMENLLGVLLKQTLRFRYFPLRIADLCDLYGIEPPAHVMPAPPELLTVLRARAAGGGNDRLVYPDPPLGTEELRLISELAPELEATTPNALVAAG